nr:SdrD B-like domain-containing protein [Herbaspirillum sp. ASV7]
MFDSRLLGRLAGLLPSRSSLATALVALAALAHGAPALAALDVSMSVAPGYNNPINPGDVTAFRITLTNSDPSGPVTGVGFTDTMPASLKVAGVGVRNFVCTDGSGNVNLAPAGTLSAVLGSSQISLAGASVPDALLNGANGRCDIDVEVSSMAVGTAPVNTIAAHTVSGTDNGGNAVNNANQAQQSININNIALPTISKSFSAATVLSNEGRVRLSIVIGNPAGVVLPLNGAGDSPGFAIRDNLPGGLQVAATPNATATCSGGGSAPSFSPAAGATSLLAIGGTVAAGGSCTLAVDVIGTSTAGHYSNTVSNVISRTADFGNQRGLVPANDATASLSVVSLLQVSKQFSPGTISANQNATLTITLRNASTVSSIPLLSLSDSPIDGVGNIANGGLQVGTPTTTCPAASVAPTAGNYGVSLSGSGSLAPGASCTITVPFTGTLATPGTPQTFTNTIAEGAVNTGGSGVVSQTATHSVTVVDQLLVGKSATPQYVAPGNPVRYAVTVNNYSSAAKSNVVVHDTLPAGMVGLSSPAPSIAGTGCTLTGSDISPTNNDLHFTIGNLPAGSGASPGVCVLTFWAMLPKNASSATTITNGLPAGSVGNGATSNSNSASAGITVVDALTIGKIFNPSNAFEGTVSVLTLTVTNTTANTISNLQFTDLLPLGTGGNQLVVANPADASTSCNGGIVTAAPGSNSIALTGASLAGRSGNGTGAYSTCQVQVKVIGPADTYTNTLAAGALTGSSTFADGATVNLSSPGPVSASLVYGAALQASKSFSPATISAGGRSTVRISLANIGTGTLNNVSAIDPLPANMTLASPTNAYSTCAGAPSITAVAGAASASIAGVVLPASGRCDFLFDVTGTGAAAWVNTIPVGNVTATGGVRNTSAVTATLNNSTSGAVSVTNNTNPNNLSAPGQSSVLTVSIQNGGSLNLTGLRLANYFTVGGVANGTPTGMQLSSQPALTTTCQGGIVSAGSDGASILLSNANLAAGQSCTITANVTMITTGTVQDTIPAGAIINDQAITNATATVTSLSASGNIGVTKSFTPQVVTPGSISRLRLTLLNAVALPLTNLAAVDNLPAGVTVAANPNASTTCAGAIVSTTSGQVQVTGGSLPAASGGVSQSCIAEVDVLVAAAGSYVNVIGTGQVTGTIGNGSASNPVAASATVQARDPAVIAKSFSPTQVSPGTPSTATITISNPNAIALTAAALTDNLPANVVVAQTPNASTTCVGGYVSAPVSATSVALTGATIPANGACVVRFDVVSNIAGIYTNTIPAGGLTSKEGVTNQNPASATLTLLDPPSVNKQFNPVSITSGGVSTLTIVLGNTNATAATLTADLVDTLPTSPGPIVVAATPNLGGTCTTARVTATAGAGSISYSSGSTIPAGGCTITVDVTGTTAGSYNNFIASAALKTNAGNNVQPASANLVISPLGYISGKVFRDNNVVPNGSFEQGIDTGLANVVVQLSGTSYGPDGIAGTGDDTTVSRQALTDALGNYSFTGLYAGNYMVTEPNQPAGTNNGITTAGPIAGGSGTPGSATSLAVTPSRISGIVLQRDGSGQVSSSPNNNFAEVAPSSISGIVFLDQNNNGVKDLADTALAGVSIQLLNAAGTVVASTTTDANGAYSFTNLAPGTYSVLQPTQPANTANGLTIAGAVGHGGTAGSVTGPATLPSRISGIVLPPGTDSSGNNFAEVPSGRQVMGRVFADGNNDGVFNNSDSGLAGVTINLTGTDVNGNPVSRTTTTGADGRYSFAGLPEGTYTVTEPTQPPRTTNGITTAGSTGGTATPLATLPSAISGINLTGLNTVSVDNNFAEVPLLVGAVAGRVYVDTNGNGVIDAGETGIAGVTVKLSGTDANGNAVNLSTTTAADGSYSFSNLQPSNGSGYTLSEIQPALYADGRTTIGAGNPGVLASAKPVLSNNADIIRNVVVLAGDNLQNYNFGEGGALSLRPPIVNGYVYLDSSHTRVRANDGSSAGVAGWTVTLTRAGTLICTVTTDANGFYQFDNLHCPGYEVSGLPTGSNFMISFSRNGNVLPQTPTSGDNRGTANTGGTITGITLVAADQVVEQNLPLDPSGVVYDAQSRKPVAGATVTIAGPAGFNPAVHLVGGSASQVTGSDGFYQFLLQNAFPAGVYTLTVTSPAGYLPGVSGAMPPCNGTVTVGAAPNPALVQASNTAPASSVALANPAACVGIVAGGAATTQYYLSFFISAASADILNNHIPLDPGNSDVITVIKSTPMINVSRGDLVPYTITAINNKAYAISAVTVRDQIPAGFKYRSGSATYNGVRAEPAVSGRTLSWTGQNFAANEKKVYRLILVVGTGVGDGTYTNQAWAANSSNTLLSRIAEAQVRVVPDPTFDCPDIIGKVFDDRNANGYQDQDEPGIPAVRVVTPRGLLVMTDSEGRFHVPCPDIPNQDRGANFVMKLDERTLPSGYRLTTENPRDVRITRGKVTKLNFGATIHRVVRLELSDAAFIDGQTVLQPQWQQQMAALPEQLKQRPSVVRLAYQRGSGAAELVRARMEAIRQRIQDDWHAQKGAYTLNIEIEDAQ